MRFVSFVILFIPACIAAQSDTSLLLPAFTVSAAPYNPPGYAVWRGDSLPIRQTISLTERLLWDSPLQVRANAPGALATVSARGAGPNRTAVWWNGINLQSPMHGVSDVSLMPIWPDDRLEARLGGQSASQSGGSVGGSVVTTSLAPEAMGWSPAAALSMGSFRQANAAFSMSYAQAKGYARLRWAGARAENDFPYTNTTLIGSPTTRQINNEVKKSDWQFLGRRQIRERHAIQWAAWRMRAERAIPPAMTEAFSNSSQRDRATRASFIWATEGPKERMRTVKLTYADEWIAFNLRGDVDSSRAQTLNAGGEWTGRWRARSVWKTGLSGTYARAQADGYADTARYYTQARTAFFFGAEHRRRAWRFSALLRQEWAEKQGAPFTWSLSGIRQASEQFSARFHLSRNFNLPTFNDRFWKGSGVSRLKTESGYSADVGFQWKKVRGPLESALQTSVYGVLVDDWIIWLPGADGIFRPGNLRKVWSRGIESDLHVQYHAGGYRLRFFTRYQLSLATHLAAYDGAAAVIGRQLPYVPRHNAAAGLSGQHKRLQWAYTHQWAGVRFTSADQSESLPAYMLGHFMAGYQLSKRWGINAQVNNCWNEAYQLIAYRAMPGRAFQAGLHGAW